MRRIDPARLRMLPLSQRKNKLSISEIAVGSGAAAPDLAPRVSRQVSRCAERVRTARAARRPVILTFGAHLIKNGLGPLAGALAEAGWLTHLATNGAGSIHDWEFAYLGRSAEDVRENTAAGRFGTWDETGRFIHLAVAVGGAAGLGYGESVGKLIHDEHLHIPSADALRERIAARLARSDDGVQSATPARVATLAADADLLHMLEQYPLPEGRLNVPHAWRRFSLQCAAFGAGVPFTVHPGIGYDIIYTHPMACGGAIGRGALRDFHAYAASVAELSGGVHLAVGSSVMAPMIFEKALSMANNMAIGQGQPTVSGHFLAVVDIQDGGGWDWRTGEPPMDHPAYYLRFCKTFNRMGGELDYIQLDNGAFLVALARLLLDS